jgi:hypothetical protein
MRNQFLKNAAICLVVSAMFAQPYFLFGQENSVMPKNSNINPNANNQKFHVDSRETLYTFLEGAGDKLVFREKNNLPMQPVHDAASGHQAVGETLFEGVVPVMTKPIVKKAAPSAVATNGTHCPAKKDRPGWSSDKNKNHIDEDCCSDYDEWPRPGCAYTAKDFAIMLTGPTKGHKEHR